MYATCPIKNSHWPALRDSEERFRDLVENANDIIYTHDLAGRLTSWNCAGERITGYTAHEIVGGNIAILVAPDQLERARRMIAHKVAEGGRTAYELELLTKDGRRLTVEISSRLARQPGKRRTFRAWPETLPSGTAPNRRSRMPTAKKMNSWPCSPTSCAIRWLPFATPCRFLPWLRIRGRGERAMRDMMDRQVQHMVRLVDDLLDVSRITRGKLELRRERVDVLSIVATAVESCRPFLQAKQQLAVKVPNQSIFVYADRARLAQVLANLLNNAANTRRKEGMSSSPLGSRNDEVVITVRDNGVGIPPEMLAHVFDLFMQVNSRCPAHRAGWASA